MIRIKIKLETINSFLRAMSGTIHVEEVNEHVLSIAPIEILTCKFRKSEGVIGYSSMNENCGIPSKLFATVKPIIDTMIKSYWKGMILDKEIYQWLFFDDSDESWSNISKIEEESQSFIEKTIQNIEIEEIKEVVQSGFKSI